MEMQNKLYGKTIIWNGDSICAGTACTGSWATRIAEKNNMTFKNYAVGGGTIAENPPLTRMGTARHSVSATLDCMYAEYPKADYVIIEGGTNDADLLGLAISGDQPTRLGTFDLADYSGSYDRSTFCGALESVFYRATKYWLGKKIGFVVAQKMLACEMPTYNNRRHYYDQAILICRKWGIPYIDLWNGCYLNPHLPWMHNPNKTPDENETEGTYLYRDGQHLTARGYDITADIIDSWIKSL